MEGLKKLMDKKADKEAPMDPKRKEAKISTLEHLRDLAKEMMMEDLKGSMKGGKVTVASDSPEGLKEGLEKAKDVVEKLPEGSPEEESQESPEEEMQEIPHDMSEDEIDKKLAELMKLKAAKKFQK